MSLELPTALLEEIFTPDRIVLLEEEGGSVRLLMYTGPVGDDHFVALKHAVLTPEHVKGIGIIPRTESEEVPEPEAFAIDHSAAQREILERLGELG